MRGQRSTRVHKSNFDIKYNPTQISHREDSKVNKGAINQSRGAGLSLFDIKYILNLSEVVLQISDIIHINWLSKMYQLVILVCSKVFAV